MLITLSMPASCAMMGAEMRSGTPIPAMFFTIPLSTYEKKIRGREINRKGDEERAVRRLRWRIKSRGEG